MTLWRGVMFGATGSTLLQPDPILSDEDGVVCVVPVWPRERGPSAGGSNRHRGWCARVGVHPDPAQVLSRYGETTYDFQKSSPFSVPDKLGAHSNRVYTRLSSGVYVVDVAGLTRTEAGWRRWFRVEGDAIVEWGEGQDDVRAALGLLPLDQARARYVAQVERDNQLLPLDGSSDQVAWGGQVRARVVNACPSELLPELAGNLSAAWWVDARDYDSEKIIAVSCEPFQESTPERVGRVLANLAYAACEASGEAPERCAREIVWPPHVGRQVRLWFELLGCSGVADEPATVDAYRARWRELLASSMAVTIEDVPWISGVVMTTAANRPDARVCATGTIHSALDTGVQSVVDDTEAGRVWKPLTK